MENSENHENRNLAVTIIAFACIAALVVIAVAICLFVSRDVTDAMATTPETEVISETMECTTTPETEPTVIIPEPTETIHIEATEEPSEAPSAPITEEKEEPVSMTELEMLACVIYQEAGGNGSCDNCRRYVADIVLNRVDDPRFPNTMYEVLTAPSQYGRFHWTGVKWPERASYPGEAEAVARAYRIAEEVLSGQHSELYGNGYIWQAGFEQGSDGFWCCGHFYGR